MVCLYLAGAKPRPSQRRQETTNEFVPNWTRRDSTKLDTPISVFTFILAELKYSHNVSLSSDFITAFVPCWAPYLKMNKTSIWLIIYFSMWTNFIHKSNLAFTCLSLLQMWQWAMPVDKVICIPPENQNNNEESHQKKKKRVSGGQARIFVFS